MLGRFHEISIPTPDIRASVEFFERLGFTHAAAGDTWSHPYGVLTDGRLFVGLHQDGSADTALTFVKPGIAALVPELARLGVELAHARTGEDVFNEVGLVDPSGQRIRIVEARTYSPPERRDSDVSLCGYFAHFSMPSSDFEASRHFWEPLGFVATEESDVPYPHLPLTSDHLSIAFHRPRTFERAMLVFTEPDMASRIARLEGKDVARAHGLPKGLAVDRNALFEAPDGTALLLATVPAD